MATAISRASSVHVDKDSFTSPEQKHWEKTNFVKLPGINPAGSLVPSSANPDTPKDLLKAPIKNATQSSNPFHMPSDEEVFAMRDQERKAKRNIKEQMRQLSVYEKGVVKRKNFKDLLKESWDEDDQKLVESLKKRDADKILINRQTRDRHFGKENLHDFIQKKREMFLVQYALGVKRDEMKKLEEIAQAEEQKFLDDEKKLEEDAAKFDAFLKENDKNSVEAIKKAEMETKAKLEKVQEIKKLNLQIMAIRSDMSKNEDQLRDYQRYRDFLDKLTPQDWFVTQTQLKERMRLSKLEKERKASDQDNAKTSGKSQSRTSANNKKANRSGKANVAGGTAQSGANIRHRPSESITKSSTGDDTDGPNNVGNGDPESDDSDETMMYFTRPQQLLDIFAELEENNLALIQNSQETEETLEELKQKILETETRMENETLSLRSQIDFLNSAIVKEEEKAKMLEEKANIFVTTPNSTESQEMLISELNSKVKEVYKRCIGDNEANISTLQMLTNIENRLETLFETIEMMPQDKVEQAEKMKDKERRQRLREEKMDAQRHIQEERVQRALERARAPVRKKTGKPVVFRSAPPQKKKKKAEESRKKEDEDTEYFFH